MALRDQALRIFSAKRKPKGCLPDVKRVTRTRRASTSLVPMDRLPIDDFLPAITAAVEPGTNLVLIAEPGAGKTTRVPAALVEGPLRGHGAVVVLQPRRVAARAVAGRIDPARTQHACQDSQRRGTNLARRQATSSARDAS